MDTNRTRLIQKVVQSGTKLTPYEAIHLRYLMKKEILNEAMHIVSSSDVYKEVENIRSSLTPVMSDFIIRQTAEDSPDEYENLDFAYESLFQKDEDSIKRGYCGLMLLTQLRLTRAEFANDNSKKGRKRILDFESYSYYHQESKTFTETLGTLGETFKLFVMDIDIVLTLNYYLNKLIELEDLTSLKYLKMWLSKPNSNQSKDFGHLNGAYLCCSPEIINTVLDQNHKNYINNIQWDLGGLPSDFAENSLRYIKDVLNEIIPKGDL